MENGKRPAGKISFEDQNRERRRQLLKEYLGQFYRAKLKEKQLTARLKEFRAGMMGTKAIQYSDMPKSNTNAVGSETEANVIRAEEMEERIKAQVETCYETMEKVMDILGHLPENSTERIILEYRHIDCFSWKQIAQATHYSRTACNKFYNAGTEKLIDDPEVRAALAEYMLDRYN